MKNEDVLYRLDDEYYYKILEKVFYYEELAKKSLLPHKRKMYKKMSGRLFNTAKNVLRMTCDIENQKEES